MALLKEVKTELIKQYRQPVYVAGKVPQQGQPSRAAARGLAARAGETMKLVTAGQMRVLEQRAIEAGVSIAELMEAAGLAVAQEAQQRAVVSRTGEH